MPPLAAPMGYPGQLPPQYYADPNDPLVSKDFSGWWGRSFRLAKAAWRPVALVQLIPSVPLLALGLFFALFDFNRLVDSRFVPNGDGTYTFNESTPFDWSDFRTLLLIFIPIVLVLALVGVVTTLATYRILVQVATGRPVSIGAALKDGLRRTPALIGWGLLGSLLILVGLIACILPGIYVGIVMSILPAVVLLERGNAISRVFQLFHADIGAALGRIIITALMGVAISFASSIVTGIVDPSAWNTAHSGAGTVGGIVSAVLSTGFSIASTVLLTPMLLTAYADMRARHEPFSTAYLVAPD